MKEIHLPQVMDKGTFLNYAIYKLITRQEDEEGSTFCIQYQCNNLEDYEKYRKEYAPALQAETLKKFEGKFHAFRTVMEKV